MKDLQMLVQLLSGVKVSKLNIIGTEGESGTKVQQLYDAILEGEITNDVEGAQRFFPDGVHQEKYFGKLKRKLRTRLLNTLFFIDVDKPQFTDYQKANQVCYRNLFVVKLLISFGQRSLGINIATKTFKKAIYFDFTETALLLSKELRLYYSTITGDRDKAQKFRGHVKDLLETYSAELKADEFYADLMVNFVFSRYNKPELIEKAKQYCTELSPLYDKVDSYRFRFMYFSVFGLRYEMENDYKNLLKVCGEALEYFTKKKTFGPKIVLFNFYFKSVLSNIQLQNYEEARNIILTSFNLVAEGEYNWYVISELDFLLALRSQDCQRAYDIYLQVFNQPNFNNLYQSIVERWKINEAFVHLLILKGKIEQVGGDAKKKFRINKFLNEVPKHSQDKRGANINILVLQTLFLLEKERYGEIFERIEPLRMYTSRYLKKDGTFRGNCFIKMLMQLPAGRFHKEAVKRKAAPYLKKLESMPLDTANQAVELEIIPYEELWEYVMDSLDNKVR